MQGKYIEGNQQLCWGLFFFMGLNAQFAFVFGFVFPTLMSTSIKNKNISKYLVDRPKFLVFLF